jgi:hypothetical protein
MDMKQSLSHRLHLDRRKKGDTAQLAAQLAPLEEQNRGAAERQGRKSVAKGGANQEVGAIVIDNTHANLSPDITDGSSGSTFMGMEPVVLVILVGMLVFIVFIAWQVSLLPVE